VLAVAKTLATASTGSTPSSPVNLNEHTTDTGPMFTRLQWGWHYFAIPVLSDEKPSNCGRCGVAGRLGS